MRGARIILLSSSRVFTVPEKYKRNTVCWHLHTRKRRKKKMQLLKNNEIVRRL